MTYNIDFKKQAACDFVDAHPPSHRRRRCGGFFCAHVWQRL